MTKKAVCIDKSSSALCKKILVIGIVIALAVFIGVFSSIDIKSQPAKALLQTEKTNLGKGGLTEGQNYLRFNGLSAKSVSAPGSSDSSSSTSITQTGISDLYVKGNIYANTGKNPVPLSGDDKSPSGVFNLEGGAIKLVSYPTPSNYQPENNQIEFISNIVISQELKNAIKDPMVNVRAAAIMQNQEVTGLPAGGGGSAIMELTWFSSGTADGLRASQNVTISGTHENTSGFVTLSEVSDTAYLRFRLHSFTSPRPERSESWSLFGTVYGAYKSALNTKISSISIFVEITPADDSSGINFKDYEIERDVEVIHADRREEGCSIQYVKPGDIVIISTSLYRGNNLINMRYEKSTDKFYIDYLDEQLVHVFRNKFFPLDINNDDFITEQERETVMLTSTIEWDIIYGNARRIIDDEFDVTGQTAKFEITQMDVIDVDRILFRPYLRTFVGGISQRIVRGPDIELTSDGLPPEPPQLDENDAFYSNHIIGGEYYCKGFVEGDSPEERGVYVEVDLTFGSIYVQGSKQRIYYTTNGMDPLTAPDEYRYILLDNIPEGYSNTKATLFFPMPGTIREIIVTLKLASIDYVGNQSMIQVYENIKLDCTDYYINVYFGVGDLISPTLANSPQVAELGTIELGTYRTEYDKNYQKVSSRAYRRNDLAYMRLIVNTNSPYRLFKYYNSGINNITNDGINYGDFSKQDWGDFHYISSREVGLYIPNYVEETPIIIDEALLSNINSLNFYFVFKRELPIYVGATEVVYDGLPKAIGQPTTIYSGIDIVTYYKADIEEEFESIERFTDAGTYYYKCQIVDTNYYGFREGVFVIQKANPYIVGIDVQDIIYGNSMSSAIIRCENTNPDNPDQYNMFSSSDGKVPGVFEITSPSEGTQAYLMPTQGVKNITVTFYPLDDYQKNYNALSFQTTLYVDYSTNLQIEFVESTFIYIYERDVRRFATANTYPSNQYLIYEYKREGEPDSAYTTTAPINAGVYEVRVRTDLTLSNYNNMRTTEGTDLKFIIRRQPLHVVATPATAYYQYDYDPIAEAYLVTPMGNQFIPIDEWRYEYLVEGEWTTQRPINAGIYDVMISIDSLDEYGNITGNYEGEAISTLTILKGNADSSTEFTVTYPAPQNNPAINGNISYGQTLSEINLTQGPGYRAQYSFRETDSRGNIVYKMKDVSGQFIVANRLYNPALDPSVTAFVQEMNNTILDVGRYTGATAMYITFIPDDRVNFNLTSSRINVTVVKAMPQFNNIKIKSMVYGDLAEDIEILGYIRQQGEELTFTIYDVVEVDNQIVNPTVNSKPITGTFTYIDEKNKALPAGSRNIAFRFVPHDENNVRIAPLVYLNVVVEKAMLEMHFSNVDEEEPITREYGYSFSNPLVDTYRLVGATKILDKSFRVDFFYYDMEDNLINMTAYTPAGDYKVRAVVVDNNFQGEIWRDYKVERATPILHTAPVAGTIRYNMDMSGVMLSGGRMQHPTGYYAIEGHFEFDGEPPTPMQVGNVPYDIVFYPNDSVNYEEVYLTILLRVQKAIAEVTIGNLEHTYTGEPSGATYQTNIVIRTDGENEYYVNLNDEGESKTPMDRYLNARITYDLTGENTPVNAGIYIVRVLVEDPNYTGEATAEYVIEPAPAEIIVNEQSRIQPFNNGIITLDASARDMDGNPISVMISQTFTSFDGIQMDEAPRHVGVYGVILEIKDINYQAVATSTLTITVSQINILNNTQTYGVNLPVIIEYMPVTAFSTIRYQKVEDGGGLGEVYDSKPANAGLYKILIDFPESMNSGYQGSFESYLIINKARVNLSYSGEFTYNYLGEERAQLKADVGRIRISPSPLYALNRQYEFYDEDTDEFTSVEPLDAGIYIMRVVIVDNNYEGWAEFTYTINKSTPYIYTHPVITPLTYTDDGVDAVIEGGEVLFNNFIVEGTYRLAENTMNLQVGVHNVMYKFTPNDTRNLNEIFGTTQVIIQQKDLSAYIVFYGESQVEYNTKPHYITAKVSSGENVFIEIYYNNSKTAPREKGTYNVVAQIVDKNYKGEAEWSQELRIIEGTPQIVAPQLTDIYVGDIINKSDIIGGFAYIKGTGEFVDGELVPGTATQIPGTFSFVNPNQIMTKANYHTVRMSFKPFAVNNFSNVSFDAVIRVIGEDTTQYIGEVVAIAPQEVYYGQNLENFELMFINSPPDAVEGVLSFVDINTVPEVGDTVAYRFTPYDKDRYNIVEGQVEVTIAKTNPTVHWVEAKAFYGQTLRDAIFSYHMVNYYNSAVPVSGEFELLGVTGFDLDTVLTVNALSGLFNLTEQTPQFSGTYRFTSKNYNDVEGQLTIKVYHKVDKGDIFITNATKPFDFQPLSVGDMGISVSHTEHPLFDENFSITIYDNKGQLSDGVEVGRYLVIVEVIDRLYYGSKTIEFEVVKADISENIFLSYTQATFGETFSKPHAVLSGDIDIPQDNFVIEFKLTTENPNAYNETMPSSAGRYDVRIRVVDNPQFTAEKVLSFEILKKAVQVTVSPRSQTYGNVKPLVVDSIESDIIPTITYYSATYSRKEKVPTEAGMYTARVEIIDRNYTIRSGNNNYVEVSFEIRPASLTVIAKPVFEDIVYGQRLSDARILSDGRITSAEGVVVNGKYTFQNPSFKPNAGMNLVNLTFTPYNKNFTPVNVQDVELYVKRADAEILFTNLRAEYDGTNKKGMIKYVSESNAEWQIEFMQQGVVVEPVNAGTYQIRIRILSDNYQLGVDTLGNPVLQKSNVATFIIDKATMREFTLPMPTPIRYGQSLAYSTLNSNEHEGYGMVSYYGIEGFVKGKFSFLNSGLVLGDTGRYIVDIKFNPDDSTNFNSFITKIEVEVLPTFATISVTNNTFVYGQPLTESTLPTFITNPANLTIAHNVFEEKTRGEILDCGVHTFRVWITSKNYEYEGIYFEFDIIIIKKEVRLEFIEDNAPLEKYFTSYKKIKNAKARVNLDDIVMDDLYTEGGLHIDTMINLTYYSIPVGDAPAVNYGHTPPSEIGSYRVVAVMDHPNYYGTQSIYYDITLGEIEEVHFDVETLERQVYGSVVPPIITTKPSDVSYYIIYQGYGRIMPTDAGTYNIVVYFNDPNYIPKQVSAMFRIRKKELQLEDIRAENKVYDGVASLKITAKMNGVFLGDQVTLKLRAETEGGKTNPGKHNVVITEYAIAGLSAKNYQLVRPYYADKVEIFEKKVTDKNSQSFITSNNGFRQGVTVEFAPIMSPYNQENILTNLLGQRAMVQSFLIKENGQPTTLNERIKVYVKIPDEFLTAKNLEVKGIGKLADRQVNFIREGDYITFYTDSSGEIVFSTNDFSYWTIGVGALVVVIILGVIFLFMLNPRHKRRDTADKDPVRAAIKKIKKGGMYR